MEIPKLARQNHTERDDDSSMTINDGGNSDGDDPNIESTTILHPSRSQGAGGFMISASRGGSSSAEDCHKQEGGRGGGEDTSPGGATCSANDGSKSSIGGNSPKSFITTGDPWEDTCGNKCSIRVSSLDSSYSHSHRCNSQGDKKSLTEIILDAGVKAKKSSVPIDLLDSNNYNSDAFITKENARNLRVIDASITTDEFQSNYINNESTSPRRANGSFDTHHHHSNASTSNPQPDTLPVSSNQTSTCCEDNSMSPSNTAIRSAPVAQSQDRHSHDHAQYIGPPPFISDAASETEGFQTLHKQHESSKTALNTVSTELAISGSGAVGSGTVGTELQLWAEVTGEAPSSSSDIPDTESLEPPRGPKWLKPRALILISVVFVTTLTVPAVLVGIKDGNIAAGMTTVSTFVAIPVFVLTLMTFLIYIGRSRLV